MRCLWDQNACSYNWNRRFYCNSCLSVCLVEIGTFVIVAYESSACFLCLIYIPGINLWNIYEVDLYLYNLWQGVATILLNVQTVQTSQCPHIHLMRGGLQFNTWVTMTYNALIGHNYCILLLPKPYHYRPWPFTRRITRTTFTLIGLPVKRHCWYLSGANIIFSRYKSIF